MRLSIAWSYAFVGVLVACSPDEPDTAVVKVDGEDASTPTPDAGMNMIKDSAKPMKPVDGGDVVDRDADVSDGGTGISDAGEQLDAGDLDAGDVDAWVEEVDSSVGPGRIDIKHVGPCQVELDEGDDGTVNERTSFTYDAEGNAVAVEYDTRAEPGALPDGGTLNGADWIPDQTVTRTYDSAGRVTGRADDWDADGNIDLNVTYNGTGAKLTEAFDQGDDGARVDRTEWAYRSDGQVSRVERDRDGNGSSENVVTYTYDAEGRLTRFEDDWDTETAAIDDVRVYIHDGDGNLVEEARTVGGGSSVTRRLIWIYDAGLLETLEEDRNADGTPERRETWTYDGDGNLMSQDIDIDADDVVEEHLTFDPRGNVLSIEEYDGGVLEYRDVYAYDGSDRVLTLSNYDENDVLDKVTTYTYNGAGDPLSITVDSDANGSADRITRYTYTPEGEPLAVADDVLGDGADIRTRLQYDYDESGNLRAFSEDKTGDGVQDETTTYLYGCW